MKSKMVRLMPHLNENTVKVVLVVLTLSMMALAGGAPLCTGTANCG